MEADRTFISFLTASLGDFLVPVGAPVLKEIAAAKDGLDPKALVLCRRQAVWRSPTSAKTSSASTPFQDSKRIHFWICSLPSGTPLGRSVREDFLKLSAEDKDAVLEKLDLATEFARSAHADWLRDALRRCASVSRARATTWASATC